MPCRFPEIKLRTSIHFICNYGLSSGIGHIARCARLSKEAQRQNSRTTLEVPRIEGINDYHLKAFGTSKTIAELNYETDVIVLDSYEIDCEYINELRKKTASTIWLFDNGSRKEFLNVDGIINILPSATKNLYRGKTPGHCQLMLGPKYAIVSEKVESLCKSNNDTNKDILICMGGGCDNGDLRKLIEPILSVLNNEHKLVIALSSRASSYEYLKELEQKNRGQLNVILDKSDLSEIIQKSCLAIVSAGTLAYECNALGTPTILFSRADNQHKVATSFDKMNAGIYLGKIDDSSIEKMKEEIRLHQRFKIKQKKIVPPDGAAKIIRTMLKLK